MGVDPITILAISSAIGVGSSYIGQQKAQKKADQDAALARQQMADLQSAAAAPKPVIPAANDEAVRRAKERSIASQIRRRGRASTILTDTTAGTDALGTA